MTSQDDLLQQAFEALQRGDCASADTIYRNILQRDPQSAAAWYGLGVVSAQRNLMDDAIGCFLRADAEVPDSPEINHNLGKAFLQVHDYSNAIKRLQRVLILNPEAVDAWNDLGNAFRAAKRLEDSIVAYQRAIKLAPHSALARYNSAIALSDAGLFDQAIEAFKLAAALQPDFAEAYHNLGGVLTQRGRFQEAVEAYQAALRIRPDYVETFNNLGNVYQTNEQFERAIAAYRASLRLQPDSADTLFNLGNALSKLGELDEALSTYESARRITPNLIVLNTSLIHLRQQMGQWDGNEKLTLELIEAATGSQADQQLPVTPFLFISLPYPTTPAQQLRATRAWTSRHLTDSKSIRTVSFPSIGRRDDRTKLRIGYLSGDFREHPVGRLMVETLEKHDHARFEVYGYSFGPDDGSTLRRRIARSMDGFRDIADRSHRESADLIAADGLDILIDLQGHTYLARPEILAVRPAPIQIEFLGYPGTMATEAVDYVIADDFVLPFHQQPYWTERILHVPGCYQPNTRHWDKPLTKPARSEHQLPDEAVVLCSFNAPHKITRAVFEIWMRAMQRIPQSVLWLLSWNRRFEENLRREAEVRGIDRSRLIFAPTLPNAQHLSRLQLADLFLDSYPYSAHTTASDALRVGVPVATIVGEAFATRVAGSLLRDLRFPELIANNLEEYEALIVRLASDRSRLQRLREKLVRSAEQAETFDGEAFARKLERIYSQLVESRSLASPDAIYNRANAAVRSNDLESAIFFYQEALRLRPDFPQARRNLAIALTFRATAYIDDNDGYSAVETLKSAVFYQPDLAAAYHEWAKVYQKWNRPDLAVEYYRQALKLGSKQGLTAMVNQMQYLCDWNGIEQLAGEIIADNALDEPSMEPSHPFPFFALPEPTTPSQQLQCAQRWASQFDRQVAAQPPIQRSIDRKKKDKLRVGYLSSDFREHATAWLMAEMLESHDTERFEVFGYSDTMPDNSSTSNRIRRAFTAWLDVTRLSDRESAQRIADDDIDILIDLKGYTQFARPSVMAFRPAPLQVNFLGFPATMGASFIDYLVADEFIIPREQEAFYSEAIAYLPGCYQPNDSRIEIASTLPTREMLGLPEKTFVFGNFCSSYKITPMMFAIWMKLLQRVPESVMWLLDCNPKGIDNLRREAAKHGVAAERLVFAPFASHPTHLARLLLMDVCLDTFPVSAHTTAGEALRMGVPLVTMVGEAFASRVAGSLLSTLGLANLVAHDPSAYQNIALQLATDRRFLHDCKARLKAGLMTSRLFDGRAFVKNFEAALSQMWDRRQKGLPPQTFRVIEN